MTKLDNILKSRDITWPTKVYIVKAMFFPIVMYIHELDHKEDLALMNWCFQTVVLKKTLESPLDGKEIQPVNPKGNQHWIFIESTDAAAEAARLWPPDVKNSHLKIPWCWERLRAGEEGDDRGWGVWMASLTRWTWVWANSGRQWRSGKPGVLQSMRSQRVGHNLVTEQQKQTSNL